MLRSGSICMSFLYNYMTDNNDEDEKNNLNKKYKQISCLSDTLQDYGGVLSKVSQMLSVNDQSNTVFSECAPLYYRDKTTNFFKECSADLSDDVKSIDFHVYKSGSIGQVYTAEYNGEKIIFKVQYVGIIDQINKDLKILETLSNYMYSFADIKYGLSDIKSQLYKELDYESEIKNQQRIYEFYEGDKHIEIPKIIPELCINNVLCMNFMEGESLDSFISNSTQEEKNNIGMHMIRFIFKNIYVHGLLYSDIHYGNFLIRNRKILCVLDFGCVQELSKSMVDLLKKLHQSLKHKDEEEFYVILEELGIIDKDISEKSKRYAYEYFNIQYEPWISDNFEFTEDWIIRSEHKETDFMSEWKLPKNMVYFNKIAWGGYHLFTNLKLKGSFSFIIDQITK